MAVRDGEEDQEWGDGEAGDVAGREEKWGIRWGEVWMALGDMKNWVTAVSVFHWGGGGGFVGIGT